MSRDGKGEIVTKQLVGGTPRRDIALPCGGFLRGVSSARYRRCSLGHTHCTQCHRGARRFGKGWTCGKCPRHVDNV
jgi:hypothetical protein